MEENSRIQRNPGPGAFETLTQRDCQGLGLVCVFFFFFSWFSGVLPASLCVIVCFFSVSLLGFVLFLYFLCPDRQHLSLVSPPGSLKSGLFSSSWLICLALLVLVLVSPHVSPHVPPHVPPRVSPHVSPHVPLHVPPHVPPHVSPCSNQRFSYFPKLQTQR